MKHERLRSVFDKNQKTENVANKGLIRSLRSGPLPYSPSFYAQHKPRGGKHSFGKGEAHKLHSRKLHGCLFPEGAEGSKKFVKKECS